MEPDMQERMDPGTAAPGIYKAMRALQAYVDSCGLGQSLVKLRASQINGCAYCIAMHARDARAGGESNERLDLLSAWREAPIYSARERAALAWTEAVTLLTVGHVPDEVFAQASGQFSEKELADLTAAVVVINGWNRFSVAFRKLPETAASRAA
jgi:AhpD family alkylhydroperoxidase